MNYVDALTRCREPHQVLLSIQDALIARHILRDGLPASGESEAGETFGSIDCETLDRIEEVFENARKTTKILAKHGPEADVLGAGGD